MTCVFCSIVQGDLPASVVHEDDDITAFLDQRPVRPGHLLVVPRFHGRYLADIPAVVRGRVWEVAGALSDSLRRVGLADDVHLVMNDGSHALQTVPHAHVHVIPRVRGDGLRFVARLLMLPIAPLLPASPRSELDALAVRIRAR